MRKLLRVSERHQITLPPQILKDAGVAEGAYLEIEARDGKIILEPKNLESETFSADDWKKLDELVSHQVKARRYAEYPDPRSAKRHLK